MIDITEKYKIKKTAIKNKPNQWDSLLVEIFLDDTKVGEYVRNYDGVCPFYPFTKNGKEYALYSKDYTATRVMSLPDCKDLGGEERDQFGFCPVEYYVPVYDRQEWKADDMEEDMPPFEGDKGFVSGCVWGNDGSWKIQFLDLSEVEKGGVVRKPIFGYLELPEGISLKDAIHIVAEKDFPYIQIATPITFNFETGEVGTTHWKKPWLSWNLGDENEKKAKT